MLNPKAWTKCGNDFAKKLNTIKKQIREGRWQTPSSFITQLEQQGTTPPTAVMGSKENKEITDLIDSFVATWREYNGLLGQADRFSYVENDNIGQYVSTMRNSAEAIMGEIRGPEILDFIGACATGHEGSITTIHANNPRIAFMRMTQLYKQNNVPAMRDEDILKELHEVVDIIVQLAKTPTGRKVTAIYYRAGDKNQEKNHL